MGIFDQFRVTKRQMLEGLIKHLEEEGLEPLDEAVVKKWTKEAELEEQEHKEEEG